MQKKKTFLLTSLVSAVSLFFPAFIQAESDWIEGVERVDDVATIAGIGKIILNALSIAFSVLAFGGFIMLIISGVKLMLSGSDAQGTRKAANSIRNVVIGLVLALGSFLIVQLISSLTGVTSILNLKFGD